MAGWSRSKLIVRLSLLVTIAACMIAALFIVPRLRQLVGLDHQYAGESQIAVKPVPSPLYTTYYNARFAYSISYPAEILYPQGESDNGDGQKFMSKDSRVVMIVYGYYNALEQTLQEVYLEESRGGTEDSPNKVVTYKTIKDNWFVVSGYEDGRIFYQKTLLKDGIFKTFRIDYGETEKDTFDSITTIIARSFVSKG